MLPFNANVTEQTMALMKGTLDNRFDVQGRGLNSWNALQKSAVTTAANIVGYDLQAPARLLLPVITPIRNSLPRRSRAANPGTQANWKTINLTGGFTDAGYNQMGYVNEGARAPQISYSAGNNSAAYQTIGVEDALTFEAESAAQGFEDANSLATFNLLQSMMIKEEMLLLAGNNSVLLGTPATPSTSSSGTAATIPTATYSVRVVALTVEGYANSSLTGGVATSKQITGPDGKISTINGGSSQRSATASQAITLGGHLLASTTVINGAVAYAWFIGDSGTEYLQAITTINSVNLSTYTTSTQTAASMTVDRSANNGSLGGGTNQVTAFNGLMSTTYAAGAGGNSYVTALATGTAGVGTKLTSTTKGTVTEIDALLFYLWNTWNISPTKMYVNAQQQQDLTTLCLNTASSPLLRINSDGKGSLGGGLTAGTNLRYYTNFFTMGGEVQIPVELHPKVPPGTIFFQCEQLPAYYVNNETPQVAEVLTRRDYYRIDWPLVTRERQYGVYSEEVLAVYATFGFAIITNIAPL